MKNFLIYLLFMTLITSCNLVQHRVNRLTRKLERKTITQNTFSTDSIEMNYWIGGQGPTIIFIHGFGGDALMSWEKELKEFSKNHTVIAPDILWFGKSTSLQRPNLSAQREAIVSLLKHLKIEKATLVGQSYGGFIAIDVAMNYPSNVEKLVVANCPGTTFNVQELEKVCAAFNVKTVDELFIFYKPEHVQRLLNLATFKDPKLPKFILSQAFDYYFDYNHEEQLMLMNSLPAEQYRFKDDNVLKSIETMVLWGEKDEIFYFDEGKRFADQIQADFISIPDCGHAPQVDAPKTFISVLDTFFRK